MRRPHSLRPDERIRRRAEYQHIYAHGTKVHGRCLTLFVLANGGSIGRLGVAATKKLGGSVERNRAKRLIREIFRLNKSAPGFDVVVVPKREFFTATQSALETEFRTSLNRCLRRR